MLLVFCAEPDNALVEIAETHGRVTSGEDPLIASLLYQDNDDVIAVEEVDLVNVSALADEKNGSEDESRGSQSG